MCGRYVQSKSRRQYERYMRAMESKEAAEEKPSWNIPPTATSWVARQAEGNLFIDRLTWGFVGSQKTGLISNARIESVCSKPTFAEAWRTRRCAIPVEGWYEWKTGDSTKQPVFFSLPAEKSFCLAGLFQNDRFVVITAETHGQLRSVHTRRPVTLDTENLCDWLASPGQIRTSEDLLSITMAESAFSLLEVTDEVNSTRNDGPRLLAPRGPRTTQSTLAL